jgi:hypothetical protein
VLLLGLLEAERRLRHGGGHVDLRRGRVLHVGPDDYANVCSAVLIGDGVGLGVLALAAGG